MARDVIARTTLRCWLRVETPLHPGGPDDPPGVDATVARDVAGRTVVRGTALAGALSTALGVNPAIDKDDTWGWSRGAEGTASRIWFEDALVGAAPQDLDKPSDPADAWWQLPPLDRQDGVGIDRADGAAAAQILYGHEVIAPGAVLALRLTVDSIHDTLAADERLLARVLGVLRDGLGLGARTSRGLGLVRLAGTYHVERTRFDSADAFLDTLVRPQPVPLTPGHIDEPDAALIEIAWRPDRAVLVAAGTSCDLVDVLPRVTPDPDRPTDRLRLLLPGRSSAGALRSRGELIARTVRGEETPTAGRGAQRFADQITQHDLVTALFGAAADHSDSGPGRSPLTVADCVSETTINRDDWDDLVLSPLPDEEPERKRIERVRQLAELGLHVVDRVALDRWTGGAAKGRLYSRLEPVGFSYRPLRLRLHRGRIPEHLRDAATMLLLLVIRDLADGWVPLGAATTQGLGGITVQAVTVRGLRGYDGPLDLTDWPNRLPEPLKPLVKAWRRWCDNPDRRNHERDDR